ncbi:hypothetical protein [Prosthecobacter sp.]|uniref:hypothetical protein n=1 Tax=Prosthecobacter sp. TaxID=1965333 RepID=UPI003784B837
MLAFTFASGYFLKSTPPPLAPVHVHLGHQFRGQRVSIRFNDVRMFDGHVQTDDKSQHAASLQLQPPAGRFELEVSVTPGKTVPVYKTEKISLGKGGHLILIFSGSERLDIFQSDKAPDVPD